MRNVWVKNEIEAIKFDFVEGMAKNLMSLNKATSF